MPLTDAQRTIARLLAPNRTPDSYLAGGSALHFRPNTRRYSNDLDYFHDSEERVASAFRQDRDTLVAAGWSVDVELQQPGYVRAVVSRSKERTRVEWARDSEWRFMPALALAGAGFMAHPVDLALNKVLALAGRDEARDYLDVLTIHEGILPLGALCWAAVGKDPGFAPLSLLELLKRRGRYRPEDFDRLRLAGPVDLPGLKAQWLRAMDDAERFIRSRPADEAGCLYYAPGEKRFVAPADAAPADGASIVLHHGRPGGVLPRFFDGDALAEGLAILNAGE